jgi:hypothetical protein
MPIQPPQKRTTNTLATFEVAAGGWILGPLLAWSGRRRGRGLQGAELNEANSEASNCAGKDSQDEQHNHIFQN